jgi:serine/threonine protein kinase
MIQRQTAGDGLIGQTFGQYQILEDIGHGGMATVYKAWQRSLERYVAIKVLFPHLSSQEFVQRFQQEAIVVASLNHPNIVTIYEVEEQDGYIYIAMEYIDGHPLSQIVIDDGVLAANRLLHILRQVAAALDYAHQRHFIHRDIKSSNILVTAEGRAVIADFGIAKAMEGSGATAQLTSTGTVMGTPAYMSPEQIQGFPLTTKTDLYSLGIVCYEMLAGRLPFGGATTAATMYAQVNSPPPSIRQINPSVPKAIEKTLERMLAKRPEERFPIASAFVDELSAGYLAKGSPVHNTAPYNTPHSSSYPANAGPTVYQPPQSQLPPYKKSPKSSPLVLITGIATIAVLIGLSILVISFFSKPDPTHIPTVQAGKVVTVVATPTSTPTTHLIESTPTSPPPSPTHTSMAAATETATSIMMSLVGKIAFASKQENNVEILVMNSDGSGLKNLTNSPTLDYWPRWSPDGTKIAFHSYELGQQNAEIYVMDADGTNWIRLTRSEAADKFPDWSPDGTRIVFASDRDSDYEIYLMDSRGAYIEALTDNPAKDYYPIWCPDGTCILFDSDRDANTEIYSMNLSGQEPINLTNNPATDTLAAWSPDGTKIAFSSDRSGQFEVWVMNASGTNATRLTTQGGQEPRWSPDGKHIIFVSTRDGNMDLYVMNSDGSDQVRLTDSPNDDWNPCWSR